MAWTAPRTWVTSEVVTATHMNTHVRDNILETAPAKATTAGSLFVATGANAITERRYQSSEGDNSYTGAGASDDIFLGFASGGWSSGTGVAVTATTGTTALVFMSAGGFQRQASGALSIYMSYAVSGASTISALVNKGPRCFVSTTAGDVVPMSGFVLETGLSAGSNTFTLQARSSDISDTTAFKPRIFVLPL